MTVTTTSEGTENPMVLSAPARKAALVAALSGLATLTAAGVGMGAADAASGPPSPQPRTAAQSRALAAATVSRLVEDRPAALRAGVADTFIRRGVVSSHGTQHVAYERSYKNLPVIGGDFVISTDADGRVKHISVAQDRMISGLSTTPTLTAAKAQRTAKARLTHVDSATSPRLVVHALTQPRLAWETTVSGTRGKELSKQTVYVDARTGTVITATERIIHGEGDGAYHGPDPLRLETSGAGGSFSLADPVVTSRVCQDAANNKTFTGPDDSWGNGDATSKETGCVDGFYGTQLLDKMLTEWLGRKGMDGKGGYVPLRVGLNDLNAYYDGSQVQIGHNKAKGWISSMDVIAHEYGHGIDDHTPGGISGNGTQEFIGDVFGALTEAYADEPADFDEPDYLVGEEVNLVGSGPIRNMYDPSKVSGDPNCYSAEIPGMEVHAAAGPGNHWFYLLAEGNRPAGGPESPICSGGPSEVKGIGIEKAGKILYNAMLMKTSDSSYLKYRTWTLTAVKDLFPGSCTEFDTVKAAWDAVSVPAQSGEPTCGGSSHPDPDPNPSEVDFSGVAALNNCSASVIRFADSRPTDPALGLTNGHCHEGGFPQPGEVLVNTPSSRTFTLLGKDASSIGEVKAATLLYATMTKTDLSLYQLGKTYQQLADEFDGFAPLTLAKTAPADGTESKVVSGYWQKIYHCSVEKTVHQLKEAGWTMDQAIKYQQPGCDTIGGTSGSPLVSTSSNEVIGVNNTMNESGGRCTLNNPCEVDANGTVTVDEGAAYGQQTWWIYTCLTAEHTLDLSKEGCELPAPTALHPRR